MKTKRSKFNRILSKTVSSVLVIWLSSVLILACCGANLWTASASSLAEEESCPMQKGHECCQKKKDAKSLSETEKDKADCCIFKPQRTLSPELQTVKITKHTLAVTEKIQIPKPAFFIKNSYQPKKVYHSAIRNRGSTYLQNCVFRI